MDLIIENWPHQCVLRPFDLVWVCISDYHKYKTKKTGTRMNEYGLVVNRDGGRNGNTIYFIFFEDGKIEPYWIEDLTLVAPNPEYPAEGRLNRTKRWRVI